MVKLYKGEQVEVSYWSGVYKGTVTGHYEDGKPRIVDSRNIPLAIPDSIFNDRSCFAVLVPSEERKKVENYFNRRSFLARFCYLFTGKMPS